MILFPQTYFAQNIFPLSHLSKYLDASKRYITFLLVINLIHTNNFTQNIFHNPSHLSKYLYTLKCSMPSLPIFFFYFISISYLIFPQRNFPQNIFPNTYYFSKYFNTSECYITAFLLLFFSFPQTNFTQNIFRNTSYLPKYLHVSEYYVKFLLTFNFLLALNFFISSTDSERWVLGIWARSWNEKEWDSVRHEFTIREAYTWSISSPHRNEKEC